MPLRDFIENSCRFCKRSFCCKKCREKHENIEHRIFPNCDICIYGRTFFPGASEELLVEHLKSAHWPLRCVFCKRVFGTSDELKKHSKCPVMLKILEDPEKSPYTPGQSYTDSVFDSPPLSLLFIKGQQPNKNANMFSNLATSTPMQKADDNNSLEHIQEAITPVDNSETNKENIRKKKQQEPDSGSLKRKVTFCETPLPEGYRKQKNVAKKHDKGRGALVEPPSSGSGSSGIFYSLKEEPQEAAERNQIDKSLQNLKIPTILVTEYEEEKSEDKESISIKQEDSTLWISAANGSTSNIHDTKSEDLLDHVAITSGIQTPMVAKVKKRQVNIVMPTSITRNIEESVDPKNAGRDFKLEDTKSADMASNNGINILDSSPSAIQGRLWISVNRLLRNVTSAIQGASISQEAVPYSLKRRSSEYDAIDGPSIKRYKLTDIKCRRTIRELPTMGLATWQIQDSTVGSSYSHHRRKIFVDKATQTEDILLSEVSKISK